VFFWIVVWGQKEFYDVLGPFNSITQAQKKVDALDVMGYEIEKLPTLRHSKARSLVESYLKQRSPKKFKDLKAFLDEKKTT